MSGMFDKMKEKAGNLIGDHGDKAKNATEKAGDTIDEKTGGEHSDKVDSAQEKASEWIDNQSGQGEGSGEGQQSNQEGQGQQGHQG